jgi:hypothetical protein
MPPNNAASKHIPHPQRTQLQSPCHVNRRVVFDSDTRPANLAVGWICVCFVPRLTHTINAFACLVSFQLAWPSIEEKRQN